MKYKLETISGTEKIVREELSEKFENISILGEEKGRIEFESEISDVDKFRTLLSSLRIQKENGLIRNLFRRDWKIETSPAGINPSLAYILCRISKIDVDDIVLDPFCGAGTIGITAAKYFSPKKVLMSDKSGTAIDMTIKNIKAAGIKKDKVVAFRSNVSMLKLSKESVSRIITNPPFGIRTGNHEENIKIYKELEKKASQILKNAGIVTIITQEKELIESIFKKKKYKIFDKIVVSQGGLFPTIYSFQIDSKKITTFRNL